MEHSDKFSVFHRYLSYVCLNTCIQRYAIGVIWSQLLRTKSPKQTRGNKIFAFWQWFIHLPWQLLNTFRIFNLLTVWVDLPIMELPVSSGRPMSTTFID
jgi:hypothetical protein